MNQEIPFRLFRAIQYRVPCRSQVRQTFFSALQAGSSLVRALFACLILFAVTMPVTYAQKVQIAVDATKTGAKIDRNISTNLPNTSATAFTKEFGSASTPKSQPRAESVTMSSQCSKR